MMIKINDSSDDVVMDAMRILRDLGAVISFPDQDVWVAEALGDADGDEGISAAVGRMLLSSSYQGERFTAEECSEMTEKHEFGSDGEYFYFVLTNVAGAAFCVLFVALIAGLFLGYMTLESMELQVLQRGSLDENERMYAGAILPIVKDKHRVLVTLLFLNGLAYETLPLFLDELVPSWVAILLSVTLILVFGEILPSGIFTGPRQLYLGYRMLPLMKFFLWICYPVAHPMALVLDYMVGADDPSSTGIASADDEGYHRGELSALIRIQHENDILKQNGGVKPTLKGAKTLQQKRRLAPKLWVLGDLSSNPNWSEVKAELMDKIRDMNTDDNNKYLDDESATAAPSVDQIAPPLHRTEVDVMEGALRMKTSMAMDVYTPLSKLYSIPSTMVLDKRGVTTIYGNGFSRVPIYEPNPDDPDDTSRVQGFLMTRQLMLVDWDDKRELSTLPLQRPTCVSPRMNLVDLLRIVQTEGRIMTFVCARPDLANIAMEMETNMPPEAGFMGIVTLEDIIESILQDRIYDESDIKDRDRSVSTLQRWAATTLQGFYRRKASRRRSSAASQHSQSQSSLGSPKADPNQGQRVRFHNVVATHEGTPLLPK